MCLGTVVVSSSEWTEHKYSDSKTFVLGKCIDVKLSTTRKVTSMYKSVYGYSKSRKTKPWGVGGVHKLRDTCVCAGVNQLKCHHAAYIYSTNRDGARNIEVYSGTSKCR